MIYIQIIATASINSIFSNKKEHEYEDFETLKKYIPNIYKFKHKSPINKLHTASQNKIQIKGNFRTPEEHKIPSKSAQAQCSETVKGHKHSLCRNGSA